MNLLEPLADKKNGVCHKSDSSVVDAAGKERESALFSSSFIQHDRGLMDRQATQTATFTLPGIEDETVLRPRSIAESVYDEASSYISRHRFLKMPDEDITVDWLADRANALYRKNATFRLRVQADEGKQHLTDCMRKWLTTRWAKTNPELCGHLPDKFKPRTGLLW